VTILSCKRCGAVKVPGGWRRITERFSGPEELAAIQMEIILQDEIKILGKNVTLSLEETKKLDRVSNILVSASGQSHEDLQFHEEEYPIEIRFNYGTCETCGRMSGGYYEAILQIRADNRQLSDEEKEFLTQKVREMTIARYKSDDKAFVTTIHDDKYGLDFYIGSEHLCRYIADELETQYIAERKENYSLVGEDKAGNRKYRITILIKLPQFSVGDFVSIDDEPCQIVDMGKNALTCFALSKRERFSISPKSAKWKTLEFLAPMSERREFMVVTHVYGQPVTLMDSTNYETLEVDEPDFDLEVATGETIYGLRFNDRFYVLPEQKIINLSRS